MHQMAVRFLAVLLLAFNLSAWGQGAQAASGGAPPRFEVPAPAAGRPLTFVVYGDTRFTERDDVANAPARRALVHKIAGENPAAIFIGGDLVYEGSNPQDYATYKSETLEWANEKVPVFPALGNHEFQGCAEQIGCLENWWLAFSPLNLRPHRWYSVSVGPTLLTLVLDSDSPLKPGSEQREWLEQQIMNADEQIRFLLIVLHYPPVRDPIFPRAKQEKEVARYLARKAGSLRARVVVVGSHVHNYERFNRDGVTRLVSGGGGAKPVRVLRMSGELSRLRTAVNFHYVRFVLEKEQLTGSMVRFDASGSNGWTEPDRFEVRAKH